MDAESVASLDHLFDALGVGRWTLAVFFTYLCWAFLLPPFSLGGAFYNGAVDHWCDIPQLSNSSWTLEQRLNYSIPWEENRNQMRRSQCRMYVRDYEAVADLPWSTDLALTPDEAASLETTSCSHWEYDTSTFHSTVASESDVQGMVMERFGRYWNGWDDIRTLLEGYRNVTSVKNSAWVGRQKLERLRMLPDRYEKDTVKVPSRPLPFHYHSLDGTGTVARGDWDLVCDRAYLSPLFQSFYYFGCAVGDPVLGLLSDKYGRKTVVFGVALIFSAMALTSALAHTYPVMLVAWFVMGLMHPICGVVYVKVVEACPTKHRTVVGILTTSPFALGGMAFGGWAFLLRDWRTLQLVCMAPAALLLAHLPFIDESPRWLAVKGRVDEAERIFAKAARWHGVALPAQLPEILQKCKDHAAINEKARRLEKSGKCGPVRKWMNDVAVLVSSPALRRITLVMFGNFFFTGFTYWGISLAGNTFSQDPFLYMLFSSALEVPAYTVFAPIVMLFGRRRVLAANFAVCAAAILAILIVPGSWTWVIFSLALVGKFFITGNYNVLYLVCSEVFPTCVRSRGLNLSSTMARLSSILSPFIIQIMGQTYWWAPSVFFGSSAAIGGLLSLLLPETSNQPLPDNIEELRALYSRDRTSPDKILSREQEASPLNNADDTATSAV
ncbi:putative organic cation transporter protein-like [Penaeus vannamei]|uniref:Putative organic cation transporter protein-like n=1 Tax=Penaeus vannamei TaxID=6689 RepID=A0A3R7PCA3_PENVA|nr:putative organic cation transporter protein-like [Penaeus vannamei]